MASNVKVRAKQSDFGTKVMIFLVFLSALAELFEDKKAAEEKRRQRVLSMKQGFSQVLDDVAGSLANGLNAFLQHVSHFLQATVGLPVNTMTPEGVILAAQWVFLLLICYGVIALAFTLATFFLRQLWRLVKVGVALACFGLILTDHSVDTKTTVFRLLCLGCVCILLSIRPGRDRAMAARIVHLEEQVKILENRVRETDGWRRRCIFLSCCLIGLLCLVFFGVCTVISISNTERESHSEGSADRIKT